jgi:hypothetical protein
MGDPTNQHKKAMPTKIYPYPCPLFSPHWQPIGKTVSALVAKYLKYLGQFNTNYIIFRNVEIFKNYFFRIKKYCEG